MLVRSFHTWRVCVQWDALLFAGVTQGQQVAVGLLTLQTANHKDKNLKTLFTSQLILSGC